MSLWASGAYAMGCRGCVVAPCVTAAPALCCALSTLVFYSGTVISSPWHCCTLPCPATSPCGLQRVVEADGSPLCLLFCWCVGYGILASQVVLGLAPFPLDKGGEVGLCCWACRHRDAVLTTSPSSATIPPAASCSKHSTLSLSSPQWQSHHLRGALSVCGSFPFLPPRTQDSGLRDSTRCLSSATNMNLFMLLSFQHNTGDVLTEDSGFCFPVVPKAQLARSGRSIFCLLRVHNLKWHFWVLFGFSCVWNPYVDILFFRFWKWDHQRLTRGPLSYGAKHKALLRLRRRKRKKGSDLSCVRNSVPFWSIQWNFVTSF